MENKKWFVANNKFVKNKEVVNLLPFVKIWYSSSYYLEAGKFTPAFGIAISFLKWNYYFTIQSKY